MCSYFPITVCLLLKCILLLLLSHFSCVRLCATPWTAAYQAPLSMGLSRQEYWSGVPSPSPFVSRNCYYLPGISDERCWPR